MRDLKEGVAITAAGRHPLSPALPPGDVLVLRLEGHGRIILRPSGTEPKIKFYFELEYAIPAGTRPEQAGPAARQELAALQNAFMTRVSGI